jgi:uncharacterized protein
MTHTPHELHEEFPEFAEKIHAMKVDNHHFARLAEEYHRLNREIHRGETDVEPTTDEHLEELKKERLKLKDEIFGLLNG